MEVHLPELFDLNLVEMKDCWLFGDHLKAGKFPLILDPAPSEDMRVYIKSHYYINLRCSSLYHIVRDTMKIWNLLTSNSSDNDK